MLTPSTLALTIPPLLLSTAHLSRSGPLFIFGYSLVLHSPVKILRNNAFPAGIVQLRSALPPLVPSKNHTGPCCPTVQRVPKLSLIGLLLAGVEISHCHCFAPQSLYVRPYGLEPKG